MANHYFDGGTQFLPVSALVILLGQALHDDQQHNGLYVNRPVARGKKGLFDPSVIPLPPV